MHRVRAVVLLQLLARSYGMASLWTGLSRLPGGVGATRGRSCR